MGENKALRTVAELMLLSARTAPKAVGRDMLLGKIAKSDEKERIAAEMEKKGKAGWARDAKNIREAGELVLIGVNGMDENEMIRGKIDVSEMEGELSGAVSPMRLIDLGIAVGSAVKTASLHNADNRVMWRAGVAAAKLKVLDAPLAIAIPLSATGKSVFFDR